MHYDASNRARRQPHGHRRHARPASTTGPTRRNTGTGSSASRARSPALTLDIAEDGGIRPGYKLKLNSYDLGVDIELARRAEPRALRASRGALGDRHQRQGPRLLLGRQHLHARRLEPRLEGELLQVHQRDAQRHRGHLEPTRASSSSPRSTAPAPAAATSWPWPATRSSSSTTARPRSRLPEVPLLGVLPGTGGLTRVTDKRKVRHDLADIFCTSVEGVRGQRAVEWRLVDAVAKPAQFAATVHERAAKLGEGSAAAGRREGRRPDAARAHRRGRRLQLRARRRVDRPRQARRDDHREGAERRAAGRHRRDRGRGRRLVAAGDGAPARRRDPEPAHQRARDRHLDPEDRGRCRRGARRRRDAAGERRPLAGAGNDRPAAAHLRPPRRLVAEPVRPDRAGLLLRRRSSPSWPSPPTGPTCSRCPTTRHARRSCSSTS